MYIYERLLAHKHTERRHVTMIKITKPQSALSQINNASVIYSIGRMKDSMNGKNDQLNLWN